MNKPMRSFLCAITASLLLFPPAFAEEARNEQQNFRSFITDFSCGQVVKGLDKEHTRKAYSFMIGSFISGSNYVKNRDSKTDLKGMLLLTEQFCRQNPEMPVLNALIFLDKSIDKRIEMETSRR